MSFAQTAWPWKLSLAGLAAAAILALTGCDKNNAQHGAASVSGNRAGGGQKVELLNASYDVMRDFYKEFNPLFIKHYQAAHPDAQLAVQQSHGGSSKQALAVANGLQADVVTMNQGSDIELLANKGLVTKNWADAFPNHAVPFTSTTVFLVRKGNPKQIHDWADLAKPGVQIVMTNPKTGGNGRYTFLGAYGYAQKANNGNQTAAQDYLKKFFANAVALESGGRAATNTFVQRQMGDVLVTFENEANVVAKQLGNGQFDIVYPKYSVAAENPVAVVDTVTQKKGTAAAAKDYLDYLWSDEGQNLAAKLYLRPSNPKILAKYSQQFPKMDIFRPTDVFGSWADITKNFFADGGLFDRVYQK